MVDETLGLQQVRESVEATLIAGHCGSVVGFLPPSSFQLHIRRDADAQQCFQKLVELGSKVLHVASIPSHLRTTLSFQGGGGEGAGSAPGGRTHLSGLSPDLPASSSSVPSTHFLLRPSDPSSPPVRRLFVSLAPNVEGVHASLGEFLAGEGSSGGRAVADLCPSCELAAPSTPAPQYSHLLKRNVAFPVGAYIVAHGTVGCKPEGTLVTAQGSCSWDAGAECGCLIPPAYIKALLSHPDVLWVEAHEIAAPLNLYARKTTMTADILQSPYALREYGECKDVTDACLDKSRVPFSYLPTLYPTILSGAGVVGDAREMGEEDSSSSSSSSVLRAGALPEVGSSTSSLGSCSVTCSSASCGSGFSSCADFQSPLAAVGLTGAGQVVNVVDSGLDYANPFFLDPTHPVTTLKDGWNMTLDTSHRKVGAYWGMMDLLDSACGHGTHVCGSVAGSVQSSEPSPLLQALSAPAPLARIVFTDVMCDTTGGCPTPPNMSFSACPTGVCDKGPSFNTPDSWFDLFVPPYAAGARISSNSWGGGQDIYSNRPLMQDQVAYLYPDYLSLFAAGNNGYNGYRTLSTHANSKNALIVGAAMDGLDAHLAKIKPSVGPSGASLPPLYHNNSYSTCVSLTQWAKVKGDLPAGCPPAPLSNEVCVELANVSSSLGAPPPPGFDSSGSSYTYPPMGYVNMDLAFCCGCTLRQIVDYAATNATAAQFAYLLSTIMGTYSGGHNPSPFTSRGPAEDGRIKPDVMAPGVDIISARASGLGTRPYGVSKCSAAGNVSSDAGFSATNAHFTGSNSFQKLDNISTLVIAYEPTILQSVSIQFASISATFTMGLVIQTYMGLGETERASTFYIAVAAAGSSVTVTFSSINFELALGSRSVLTFYVAASSQVTYAIPIFTGDSNVFIPTCFGFLQRNLYISLVTARGGAESYFTTMSGTSMATPITSSLASLVRQYFTDGFYPAGQATLASGFSPSAALMKAVLINSASPLIYDSLDAMTQGLVPGQHLPYAYQAAITGFGTVNLIRELSFTSLGPDTRASGALPSLLIPGLGFEAAPVPRPPPGAELQGVDPSLSELDFDTYCVDIAAPVAGAPSPWLSITVVWTDYPPVLGSALQLVNNLDLEVTPPGSAVAALFGNNFNNSLRPQVRDYQNNVEKVYIAGPTPTLDSSSARRITAPYKVVVRGHTIPYGPQAYSLVVTGPRASLVSSSLCDGSPPSSASGTTDPKTVAIAVLASIIGIALVFAGVYGTLHVCSKRHLQTKVLAATKVQEGLEMTSSGSTEAVVPAKPQAV